MKAPKKLYLHPTAKGKAGASWLTFPLTNEDIEYIRKDAFTEKACGWIKENITNNPNANSVLVRNGCVTLGMLVDDFKKYMED